MTGNHNTTTPIAGLEEATIRFSSSAPDFNVPYSLPSIQEATSDQTVAALQEELGRVTIELSEKDAEIIELQTRLSYLEGSVETVIPAAAKVGQVALEDVAFSEAHAAESAVPSDDSDDTEVIFDNSDEIIEPDPSLSEAHQRYERAILYVLNSPNQAVRHPNAGGYVKNKLEISQTDWKNLQRTLETLGILEFVKNPNNSRRIIEIRLGAEKLIEAGHKKFVTKRIMDKLDQIKRDQVEDEESTAPLTPEDNASNNQQQEENNGSHASNGHVISPRVRKLMGSDSVNGSVYRQDGKGAKKSGEISPFLEHRRVTGGAIRR